MIQGDQAGIDGIDQPALLAQAALEARGEISPAHDVVEQGRGIKIRIRPLDAGMAEQDDTLPQIAIDHRNPARPRRRRLGQRDGGGLGRQIGETAVEQGA